MADTFKHQLMTDYNIALMGVTTTLCEKYTIDYLINWPRVTSNKTHCTTKTMRKYLS